MPTQTQLESIAQTSFATLMKNIILILAGFILLPFSNVARAGLSGVDCAGAAADFLSALDDAQTKRAAHAFAIPQRRAWAYVTGSKTRKQGLAIGDMTDEQRVFAHRLIRCGLSSQGYQKVAGIMHMDDLVREKIATIMTSGKIEIGKEFYWLAVFGDPETEEPWGWQLEGHHLGLNFTMVGGVLSVTPAFLGADPAEVQSGPLAGWRLLGGEEDRAYALMASLDDAQRRQAVIGNEIPGGLFTAPGRADALRAYSGLSVATLSGPQRQLLWLLIDEYVQNVEPAVADRIIGGILEDGWDRLYFAWMGSTETGGVMYYRIHGPSILIEFDHASTVLNPKLGPNSNHIHTIMRVPGSDFGADLLQQHYLNSPAHIAPRTEK
jgi:hypothetical protein